MTRFLSLRGPRWPLLAVLAAACSGPSDPPSGPCWPIDGIRSDGGILSGGEVILGSMEDEFTELEDNQDLQIGKGTQNAFHFMLSARIVGMNPGDLSDSLSDQNPRTRFTLLHADGVPLSPEGCPARLPYIDNAGNLELKLALPEIFPEPVQAYIDQPIIIRVEVIDADQQYAVDERLVIARTPAALLPDAGLP